MDFHHLRSAVAGLAKRTQADTAFSGRHNVLRDNFTLTTWMAVGAVAQGIMTLFVRPLYALAPILLLVLYRSAMAILAAKGVIHNKYMDDVLMGKYTVQIPDEDGNPPTKPSQEGVSVLFLGARSNHPLGMFGPGYRELGGYLNSMLDELTENSEESGFLGRSSWLSLDERQTANQIMTCCYFRSIEDIHKFAHGESHRKAWNWWNSIVQKHPHMSIMHEIYSAPPGMWENIYANYHLTGLGNTLASVNVDGEQVRPIVVGRTSLGTSKGRLGRSGREDEIKQATKDEVYGY